MQMLYNSDSYVVVLHEGPPDAPLTRGGYEIVDKLAGKDVFIEGRVAEQFKLGVEALVEEGPNVEQLDEFIAGYTTLAQQPLVLH